MKYDWWGSLRLGELFVPVQAVEAVRPRYTQICKCHHEPFGDILHVCAESDRRTRMPGEGEHKPGTTEPLNGIHMNGGKFVPVGEKLDHELAEKRHRLDLLSLVPLDEVPWHRVTGSWWICHDTSTQVERDDWLLLTRTLRDEVLAGVGYWYADKQERLVVVSAFAGAVLLNSLAFAVEEATAPESADVHVGAVADELLGQIADLVDRFAGRDFAEPDPSLVGEPTAHKPLELDD